MAASRDVNGRDSRWAAIMWSPEMILSCTCGQVRLESWHRSDNCREQADSKCCLIFFQLQTSPFTYSIEADTWRSPHFYAICIAEAVFYHGPNLCLEYHNNGTRVVKSTRRQLAVLMTMESAAYYPCFDDPVFMGPFDLEISYRREVGNLQRETISHHGEQHAMS